MADNIVTFFNGQTRLYLVQGTSGLFNMIINDTDSHEPVDLTGAQLTLSFPSLTGTSIKRSTTPLSCDLTTAQAGDGETIFTVESHGLVTGDQLTLTVNTGDTAPAPLANNTQYYATVVDANTFTLSADQKTQILLTEAGTITVTLTSNAFAVTSPTLGKAQLILSTQFTNALPDAQGQDYQLAIAQNSYNQILIGRTLLDVFAQPAP